MPTDDLAELFAAEVRTAPLDPVSVIRRIERMERLRVCVGVACVLMASVAVLTLLPSTLEPLPNLVQSLVGTAIPPSFIIASLLALVSPWLVALVDDAV